MLCNSLYQYIFLSLWRLFIIMCYWHHKQICFCWWCMLTNTKLSDVIFNLFWKWDYQNEENIVKFVYFTMFPQLSWSVKSPQIKRYRFKPSSFVRERVQVFFFFLKYTKETRQNNTGQNRGSRVYWIA